MRPLNTLPQQRHALDQGPRSPLYVVVDGTGAVVESFRNKALADRLASTNPSYQVTEPLA